MNELWVLITRYLPIFNKKKAPYLTLPKRSSTIAKEILKKDITVLKLNKKELESRNMDLRIQVSVLRFKLAKLQGTKFEDTNDIDLDAYAEYMFTHGNKLLQFELPKSTDDLPHDRKLTCIPAKAK